MIETQEVPRVCAAPRQSKLYIIVRRDLPWPVRMVQAIHATLVLRERWAISIYTNVVVLGVANEEQLQAQAALLPDAACFREPDLFDQLTAVAYYGPALDAFDDLRLM